MIKSREMAPVQRPTTSSLPVKPVTPRTWNKLQLEAAPEVSIFENEIYGQAGNRQHNDNSSPSYQPLSARSSRPTTQAGTAAQNQPGPPERPISRLGVQRGAVTSKFVVPPLNLAGIQTVDRKESQGIKEANKVPESSTTQAVYLPQNGLQVATADGTAAASSGQPNARQQQLQAVSEGVQRAQQTARRQPEVRNTTFKLPLDGLSRSSSKEENTTGNGAVQEQPATISRPVSRFGRPLTSTSTLITKVPSKPSSQAGVSRGYRRSGLADITSAYRSSDHNELLIKASGWVERPQSGTSTGSEVQKRPSAEATAAWVAASKSFVLPNSLRASFSAGPGKTHSTPSSHSSGEGIMPRLSNYAAARRFLLAPGPVGEPLRCRVERRKSGLLGTNMHYVMLLDEGECVMLTARRHRRANGAVGFEIFIAPLADSLQDASICVAKLNASFMGTDYVLIGAGIEEGGAVVGPENGGVTYGFADAGEKRSSKLGAGKGGEMGAVMYNPNIMGTKGPRKAVVVLPKLVPSGTSAWELQPATVDGALISKYKNNDASECIVLRNRPPRWNAALGAYCLHFGGRVTHASVKNIQLVSDDDPERVVLQFGRVGSDSFSLDYQFPVTPLQAFALALASLDPKLGSMSTTAMPTNSIQCDASLIPGFLRWIDICNNGKAAQDSGQFLPFEIDNETVGYLSESFIQQLRAYPDVFQIKPSGVHLVPSLQTADLSARSAAVGTAMASLRDAGVITGWRNELYPVQRSFNDPPSLLLERAAAGFFGIKAYGVHMNGFVRRPDGQVLLWVARRSATKPTWPGKLDHIVAGGQPYGLTLHENVIKECQEEAGIPQELAARAIPVGAVSYTNLQSSGLKRDVLFCYDLELPESFQPVPEDGEVQEFFLLPLDEVAKLIAQGTPDAHDSNAYKDNCNLVVLDFLIRHGVLVPDTPGYLKVLQGLRSGDCS